MGACAVRVVFVSVNQVLVRLWTRVLCQSSDGSHWLLDVCLTTGDWQLTTDHGPLFDGLSDRVMRPCGGFPAGWQPLSSAARVQRRCVND